MFSVVAMGKGFGYIKQMLNVFSKFLEEYKDVMSLELLKKLPPRKAVDHIIELVPSATPPLQLLYHMSPKLCCSYSVSKKGR
jgi:hypothetical protein